MIELEGIKVKHKVFGEGVVTEVLDKYITIQFESKESKFVYPDSFEKFIIAESSSIQSKILAEIKNIKQAEEEGIESEKRELDIKLNQNTTIKSGINNKSKNRTRDLSCKQYFFVFQNKSFDAERRGGYLWAPKSSQGGRKISHWVMMEEVHKGDIIIHSVNKNIRAISIAISDCYSANQPDELKKEQAWEDDGYMIDCQYIDIQHSIVTSDYMKTILELQPVKYAPFNSIGRGNTGYLFASNKELSEFFISELMVKNNYLEQYNLMG